MSTNRDMEYSYFVHDISYDDRADSNEVAELRAKIKNMTDLIEAQRIQIQLYLEAEQARIEKEHHGYKTKDEIIWPYVRTIADLRRDVARLNNKILSMLEAKQAQREGEVVFAVCEESAVRIPVTPGMLSKPKPIQGETKGSQLLTLNPVDPTDPRLGRATK